MRFAFNEDTDFPLTLSAGGRTIYGIWPYASTYSLRIHEHGEEEVAPFCRMVYNFKKYYKNAKTVAEKIGEIRERTGAEVIFAVPGHDPAKTNSLQRLFGTTIVRTTLVEQRKYNHALDSFRLDSLALADGVAVAGKRVLLVDDVCTTGGSLLRVREWLLEQGAESVDLASVGINVKLLTKPDRHAKTYEEKKEEERQRNAAASLAGRDIGAIPEVAHPRRRERCSHSLADFCRTYFPATFYLKWSPDQLKVIAKTETAVREGGLFALAMPRGSGKTSICERAALWAALYGYRKFIVLVGSSEDAARELADTIKVEIESNELLGEDFPEVCYPVRALEGINNRTAGQLCCGQRTKITWSGDEIVLPTVEGSRASGTVVKAAGITGRIRGMKRKADGMDIRPDMVLVDDPQTDESAASPEQNRKRLRVLSGAILGLAGPGKKISGVMPCTVIRPDDMADRVLDREKSPEWNGERLRLLVEFPTDMTLWQQYREISADSFRQHGDNRDGTKFYRKNRAAMDAGAESSWPQRFEPGQISAVQYAMDLYFKDRESFYAEYQNQPLPDENAGAIKIEPADVWKKLNGRKRGEIPLEASRVVAFIDVQGDLLYYLITAFADDFTGWIIDYGAFPDQKRRYFSLKEANPTYRQLFAGASLEGAVYSALDRLTGVLIEHPWVREDGVEMKLERCVIDSSWGYSTKSIYRFCRESKHAGVLLPSKGKGISAAQRPMTEYKRDAGSVIGHNWYLHRVKSTVTVRLFEYDTNYWKSFFRQRLLAEKGEKGTLTIFGSDEEQTRLLAEHLSAESATETTGGGRRVEVWTLTPGRENHWLDGIVGCMACASLLHCDTDSTIAPRRKESAPPASTAPVRYSAGRHFTAGRRFSAR